MASFRGLYAQPAFFDIFSFDLLEGNPETALASPFQVVLSQDLAARLFPDGNAVGQLRFGTTMLAMTGVMGSFRFPRSTPWSRIIVFAAGTSSIFSSSIVALSNCLGKTSCLFDAWTWSGRLLIGLPVMVTMALTSSLLETMISGKKDVGFVKKMNPVFETRIKGTFATWAVILANWLIYSPLCVMLGNKEAFFSTLAYPLSVGYDYALFGQFRNFFTVTYLSLGALYATLQYEKRLKPWQAFTALALTWNLCGGTQATIFTLFKGHNELFKPVATHMSGLLQKYNLGKIYFGYYGLVTLVIQPVPRGHVRSWGYLADRAGGLGGLRFRVC